MGGREDMLRAREQAGGLAAEDIREFARSKEAAQLSGSLLFVLGYPRVKKLVPSSR